MVGRPSVGGGIARSREPLFRQLTDMQLLRIAEMITRGGDASAGRTNRRILHRAYQDRERLAEPHRRSAEVTRRRDHPFTERRSEEERCIKVRLSDTQL
jgi:hypothetical protein